MCIVMLKVSLSTEAANSRWDGSRKILTDFCKVPDHCSIVLLRSEALHRTFTAVYARQY